MSGGGREEHFVAVLDAADGHHSAVALVGDDVTPSFTATILRVGGAIFFLDQVLVQRCAFAVAIFGYRQEVGLGVDPDQADDRIILGEVHALHACGAASHASSIGGLEADGHAAFGGQQHMVVGLGANHPDQGVAVVEVQGDEARTVDVLVLRECRAFDAAASGGKEQIATWCLLGTAEVLQGEHADNGFVLFEFQQLPDRSSGRSA